MRDSFYNLSLEHLHQICEEQNLSSAVPRILFNWHYKKNHSEACDHQDLSKAARQFIYTNYGLSRPKIAHFHESSDRTVKFLFELEDQKRVESVLIPFNKKYTLCLSSQVGCAMNCAFCFTGRQGFGRHLTTAEIITQFLEAQKWLRKNRPADDRILNVVFMGQGEPLHNFDAVKTACEILLTQWGLSLAAHKITVSTSGYLPGLKRWKSEMPPVNLALSLHSAKDSVRSKIIPINRAYPLKEILGNIDSIPLQDKRFVTYEYLLIKDFNDSEEDAHETGQLLKGKKAYVNLIPFNPFPESSFERPENERVLKFKAVLDQYVIPTTIRTTKGDEILAACGQLNTRG